MKKKKLLKLVNRKVPKNIFNYSTNKKKKKKQKKKKKKQKKKKKKDNKLFFSLFDTV